MLCFPLTMAQERAKGQHNEIILSDVHNEQTAHQWSYSCSSQREKERERL